MSFFYLYFRVGNWIDSSVLLTGKPPHIIPKSVMDTVKIHDGIGYAPNPHYKRGAPKVSVY